MIFGLLILNAFFCVGLHEITRDNQVGGFIGWTFRYVLGDFWSKPFTECLTCMASVWSVPFFIFSGEIWYLWPFYSLILAGLNATYGNVFYRESE